MMENIKIEFSGAQFEQLKTLVSIFQSYYEDEKEWSFQDLDDQRMVAVEITDILNNVLAKKQYA